MQHQQLDRLRRDAKELGHYIHRLNKKGDKTLAYKMEKKQQFLNQHIAEVQQSFQ